MSPASEQPQYHRLSNGIELALLPAPRRSVVSIEMRFLAGFAFEKPDRLGVAHVLAEVLTKGTPRRDGRALNDAFDEIGAGYGVSAGRETFAFSCLCLPEFTQRALELHAEMIREPSLPDEACRVAIDLTRQCLEALEDDPPELAKKYLHQQTYGQPLNRHVYGEAASLQRMTREDVMNHWRSLFRPDRLQAAVVGPLEPPAVVDLFERLFEPLLAGVPNETASPPRSFAFQFRPTCSHYTKELEQEQIGICFPGASATSNDEAIERVTIGMLSGGMSSRLWTAIREKQGLVYWVGAWFDRPRAGGIVHLGSACTPQNLDQTCEDLLREVDRMEEDVNEQEVQRAINGIIAATQTHGDTTRATAVRLVNDLFYLGRPVPVEEKLDRIRAVTVQDVRRYLHDHPRNRLGIVTLGPRDLRERT